MFYGGVEIVTFQRDSLTVWFGRGNKGSESEREGARKKEGGSGGQLSLRPDDPTVLWGSV